MNYTFSQNQLRQDIQTLAADAQWTVNRLARESGVDQASLSRFCSRSSGLSGANIEKLWPFIYGDKRPTVLTSSDESQINLGDKRPPALGAGVVGDE